MSLFVCAAVPLYESVLAVAGIGFAAGIVRLFVKGEDIVYCIGSRTGILVRGAPPEQRCGRFDQNRAGLHHFCFRARERADVDAVYRLLVDELHAHVVHPPEEGKFAPGYYSVLFEDPDGIRVEVNHVPGKGHFDTGGRLGSGGTGPARSFGSDGLGG